MLDESALDVGLRGMLQVSLDSLNAEAQAWEPVGAAEAATRQRSESGRGSRRSYGSRVECGSIEYGNVSSRNPGCARTRSIHARRCRCGASESPSASSTRLT